MVVLMKHNIFTTRKSSVSLSGVTIMTLIVLLIIILLAYFIYCHHSEDIREHNVLQITSIDTIDGEKNLKSNSEVLEIRKKKLEMDFYYQSRNIIHYPLILN